MLAEHYLERIRKRAANRKRLVDDYTLRLSFNDFIKREVEEAAIADFYDMDSTHQTLAIKKYYLELDDLDTWDMFYAKFGKSLLIEGLQKLYTSEVSGIEFRSWYKKTVYELCLPRVRLAIQDIVDEYYQKRAEDEHDRNVDRCYEIFKDRRN